jgi:hypothetical protein
VTSSFFFSTVISLFDHPWDLLAQSFSFTSISLFSGFSFCILLSGFGFDFIWFCFSAFEVISLDIFIGCLSRRWLFLFQLVEKIGLMFFQLISLPQELVLLIDCYFLVLFAIALFHL